MNDLCYGRAGKDGPEIIMVKDGIIGAHTLTEGQASTLLEFLARAVTKMLAESNRPAIPTNVRDN